MKNDVDEVQDDRWHSGGEWKEFKQDYLRKLDKEYDFDKVLDIGAGKGFVGKVLSSCEVYGIDKFVNPVKFENSYERLEEVDLNEESIDIDESFDFAVMLDTVEHLLTPRSVLAEIYEVMEDGGILFISTHNFASLDKRLKLLAGKMPDGFFYSDYSGIDHVHPFCWNTFIQMVEGQGFNIKDKFAYSKNYRHRFLKKFGGGMYILAEKQ